MSAPRFRIFISSPGDVAEERVLANNLVRRLADEYAERAWIEPVFWEHEPLLATDTFQKQLPPPRACEAVVCVLWGRLGTRLPADITRADGSTFASGTEYEFEDAAAGFRATGHPHLLVYRKTAPRFTSTEDEVAALNNIRQRKAVDEFIQKWFINDVDGTLKAAYHAFKSAAEFEEVLEAHLRKLLERHAPAIDVDAPVPAKPTWTRGSPFRGLDVFEFEHAPIFFGRSRAVGDVLDALRTNAAAGRGFLLIVGISGGGKSSLVRAGVLPLLVEAGVIEGVALWRRAVLKPSDAGGDVFGALAAALLSAEALPELAGDGTTPAQLAALLRQSPAGAFGLIKGGLSQAAATFARERSLRAQPETRLVVVVDQLEELFTTATIDAADREAFVAALSALARSGKAIVLATLRGDFYHRTFELAELVALQEGAGQYALPLPTPAEIAQMIRHPAAAAGLRFEEDAQSRVPLDEALRDAAAASPESLPLLEFALEALYDARSPDGTLTYDAYRALGGVEGALTQRAETVFAALPTDVQATLPRVLRALVNLDTGDALVRQRAALASTAATPQAKSLVDAFIAARLFSADRTNEGTSVVRVTHEALLRTWPRVQAWLAQDRELLLIRARVQAAATRWHAECRRPDLLLGKGRPLDEANTLAHTLGDELAPDELRLIVASRSRRRLRERLKWSAGAALVALAIAATLAATFASKQKRIADRNAAEADHNASLAREQAQVAELQRKAAKEQAILAQARFDDVRTLATKFLFELDAAIADLAGSTPARGLLARTALDALSRLERESERDPGLARDVAHGLGKLGSVQLALGDHAAARASCEKSAQIIKRLADADPADVVLEHDLSVSLMQVGDTSFYGGDAASAIAEYRSSLALLQALNTSAPSNSTYQDNLILVLRKVGETEEKLGNRAAASESCLSALRVAEQIIASKPDDWRAQSRRAECLESIGDLLRGRGDYATALQSYTACLENTRKDALSRPENLIAQRSLVHSLWRAGATESKVGDLVGASEHCLQGVQLADRLRLADPGNRSLQIEAHNAYEALQSVGRARQDAGGAADASEIFERCLEYYEAMHAQNPLSVSDKKALALALENLAGARLANGNASDAAGYFGLSVERHRRPIAEFYPNDLDAKRELLLALKGLGTAQLASGDKAAATESFRLCASWASACFDARDKLATSQPDDESKALDLARALIDFSDAQRALGDVTASLGANGRLLNIALRRAAASPDSVGRAGDAVVVWERIGDDHAALGDATAAIANFREGLAIAARLALADAENVDAQRSRWMLQLKIGTALADLAGRRNVGSSWRDARAAFSLALDRIRERRDAKKLAPADADRVEALERCIGLCNSAIKQLGELPEAGTAVQATTSPATK